MLRAEFAAQGGPASVLGGGQRTSPASATLINGAMGHALDFDDTNLVGDLPRDHRAAARLSRWLRRWLPRGRSPRHVRRRR
jgi:hypothetical protein